MGLHTGSGIVGLQRGEVLFAGLMNDERPLVLRNLRQARAGSSIQRLRAKAAAKYEQADRTVGTA